MIEFLLIFILFTVTYNLGKIVGYMIKQNKENK